MKKFLMSALIAAAFTPALTAEVTGLYVGADLIGSYNSLTVDYNGYEDEFKDDSSGLRLKFGAAFFGGWRLQGYVLYETYEDPLFDSSNDTLNEIGADLIKAFWVSPVLNPFVQIGVGTGWMDVDGYDGDTASEVTVKIGAGVMYRLLPAFEVVAGIDVRGRAWEELKYGTTKVEPSESSTMVYIGGNLHF